LQRPFPTFYRIAPGFGDLLLDQHFKGFSGGTALCGIGQCDASLEARVG